LPALLLPADPGAQASLLSADLTAAELGTLLPADLTALLPAADVALTRAAGLAADLRERRSRREAETEDETCRSHDVSCHFYPTSLSSC
jgi:hypothetical protein